MMLSDTGWIINPDGTAARMVDGIITEKVVTLAQLRDRGESAIADRVADQLGETRYRQMYRQIYGGMLR